MWRWPPTFSNKCTLIWKIALILFMSMTQASLWPTATIILLAHCIVGQIYITVNALIIGAPMWSYELSGAEAWEKI